MIVQKDSNITLSGDWILANLKKAQQELAQISVIPNQYTICGKDLTSIDTSGSYRIIELIEKIKTAGGTATFINFRETDLTLLLFIEKRIAAVDMTPPDLRDRRNLLTKLGKSTVDMSYEIYSILSFVGLVFIILFRKIAKPWTIRWKTLWANLQSSGVMALPIIGLLNFMIGFVITFQGGSLLRMFGANIYAIDLIVISTLRVLGPLLTAIIVAGRTGSAFAAQIGTMVVNEEVDALRTIGIHPIDQLVIPKVFALMIAMPFLTIFADIMSIFGGMVLSFFYLDISFTDFFLKIAEAVTIRSFLIGLVQAPIFALIITLVGCYQGFQVKGDADSVGFKTTTAVVQSIFLVIIFEALFTIIMRDIGL